MTMNDLKNLLIGAGSVLVIDPGPVPSVAETRKKLLFARTARTRRMQAAAAQVAKSLATLPLPSEHAQQVAEKTAEGIEKLIEGHPKRDLIRSKVGPLRFVVFRPKAPKAAGDTPR